MTVLQFKTEDSAKVLMALFNAAKPLGMGVVHDLVRGGAPLTEEEATTLLTDGSPDPGSNGEYARSKKYFDYVHGRPLKLQFDDVEKGVTHISTRLYDRDQEESGGAETVLTVAGISYTVEEASRRA